MKLFFLSVLLLSFPVFASYSGDSSAVYEILDKNGLTSIAVSDVSDSSGGRIVALYLQSLSIKIIPECIGKLTQLRVARFENNNISRFPKEFAFCKKIRELNCAANKLSTFLSSQDTLLEITSAVFDQNILTSIPDAVCNSPTLEKLSVRDNRVTDISHVSRCTTLVYLYMDNNNIRSLPEDLGSLSKLEVLTFSRNQISYIPKSINGCTALRKLDCTSNRIHKLPEQFFECRKLVDLYISSNHIAKIPVQLGMLDSLRWLFADNNAIASLPESLSDLENLQWLSISGNQIMNLPSSIAQLHKLKNLNVSNNRLSELPASFIKLTGLLMLNLNNNTLYSLPSGIDSLQHLSFKRAEKEYGTLTLHNNNLCNLEPEQKKWADRFSAGWEKLQRCKK
ncbi:MAG: leucine-rich repeat domain-containing protein [Chitinispirillaceae bacterium]|nr:leucine-rich repeat domain-containing protein [Chitinispirillaceae bacterium]